MIFMNDNFFDISNEEEIAETKRFFARVYGWMSLALIITGLVACKCRIPICRVIIPI